MIAYTNVSQKCNEAVLNCSPECKENMPTVSIMECRLPTVGLNYTTNEYLTPYPLFLVGVSCYPCLVSLQSVYVGPVCTQQLLNYQNNSRNLSVLALSGLEVTGREREVVWAIQELNALNASPECVKGVRLWLCVRLFSSEGCGSASSDDWEALEPTCPEGRVHFILGSSVYLQDCVVGPENITGEAFLIEWWT